jgi:hypothetical protein
MTKYGHGFDAFGLNFDTPTKDWGERTAQLLRRSDVSKADVCRGALPLLSRTVPLIARGLSGHTCGRGPKARHGSPRSVSPAFRLSRQRGEAEEDTELPMSAQRGNDRAIGTRVRRDATEFYPTVSVSTALVDFPFPCLCSERKS